MSRLADSRGHSFIIVSVSDNIGNPAAYCMAAGESAGQSGNCDNCLAANNVREIKDSILLMSTLILYSYVYSWWNIVLFLMVQTVVAL